MQKTRKIWIDVLAPDYGNSIANALTLPVLC